MRIIENGKDKILNFFRIDRNGATKNKRTKKGKIKENILSLLVSLIGALLIKTFLLEPSKIPTGSMESTVMIGDFVLINKVIYGMSTPRSIPFTNITLPYLTTGSVREPKHKDIVVFEWPGNKDDLNPTEYLNYVKRCVGLPGDTVQIVNKILYVNGKEFWRPTNIQYADYQTIPSRYGDPEIFPKGAPWNRDNYGPLIIPKKGDVISLNKQNIEMWRTIIDREYGERVVRVEGEKVLIKNKQVDIYKLKKDYYFMMGDNRDLSSDSRYWGFVPRDRIVGRAEIVFWSWDPSIPFYQIIDLLGTIRLNRIAKILK